MSESKEEIVTEIDNHTNIIDELYNEMGHTDVTFKKLRVYGTYKNPLFVAKDLETLVGGSLGYKGSSNKYKPGLEIQSLLVSTPGGVQRTTVFTELGLIKAMYQSKSKIAEDFRLFVFGVIKRLAMTGVVTVKDAYADYNKIKAQLKDEMDENERQYLEIKQLRRTLDEKEVESRLTICKPTTPDYETARSGLGHRLMWAYSKPIYIMLAGPPNAHYRKLYDYKIQESSPGIDEHGYLYAIQIAEPTAVSKRQHVATVPIHAKQHFNVLHDAFVKSEFALPRTDGKGTHYGVYAATIEDLIKVAMLHYENTIPESSVMHGTHDISDYID